MSTLCAACAAAACCDAPRDACTAMKYGVNDRAIEFTASKMAICSIARLRPGLMVGGCAPGIRRICKRSSWFHLMTSCADADPSDDGAADTYRGPIQLIHAKMTSNARSRQLTLP